MKLTEYLKDKVLLLLLHMVCMAGLVIFLRLTGYSMDKCVIILVCYCVIRRMAFPSVFFTQKLFQKIRAAYGSAGQALSSRRTDAGIVWDGRSEVSGTDPQIQQIGDRADTPDGTEPERLPGVH